MKKTADRDWERAKESEGEGERNEKREDLHYTSFMHRKISPPFLANIQKRYHSHTTDPSNLHFLLFFEFGIIGKLNKCAIRVVHNQTTILQRETATM